MGHSPDRSVVFVFVDGLGIGPNDPKVNPLAALDGELLPGLCEPRPELIKCGSCFPTDAQLGIPGLPQSATGQTSLFTGKNAAKLVGRHLQGFPNGELRNLIQKESLFKKALDSQLKVTFANSYTPRFFRKRPRWVSVTTVMCETAGISLRKVEDDVRGRSLFMDFTNRFLREKGMDVATRSPEEAAEILVSLSQDYHVTLYEYFLTDLAGHRAAFDEAVVILQELDRFLTEIIKLIDTAKTSLVITSDHGNIEDMRTNRHTLNPVPTMVWGGLNNSVNALDRTLDLTDVTPAVLSYLLDGGLTQGR